MAEGIGLIPDGYVEFATPSGIDACVLEVDLGHESQTVWKGKAEHYLQLAVSGKYREHFGHERFRVLVVANSERRLHSIRKTVAAITQKIFWFATLDGRRQRVLRFRVAPAKRQSTNNTHRDNTMKYCYQCGKMTAGEPLFCGTCGRIV